MLNIYVIHKSKKLIKTRGGQDIVDMFSGVFRETTVSRIGDVAIVRVHANE